jgi:anti-sigma regulatory factor (Ser/Thr protein kinase)
LLYTDGLVERRDSSLGAGLNHLRAVVNGGPSDPDALCQHVMRMLLPKGAAGDDVAMLAMRNEPISGPRLRLELPADPDELVLIRRSMERWLATSDVDERDAYRVTLAANEACMNAIEHGFGGPSAGFELDAELTGSQVDIVVRDRGKWRSPRAPEDGRGLPMMRALMDDVEVTTGPDGTTVRLRRAVRRDPFA